MISSLIPFATDQERFAWIAAMVDAESHLGITNTRNPNCRTDQRYYLPRLLCENTNFKLIKEYQVAVGCGTIRESGKRKSRKPHWKRSWELQLTPNDLRKVLPPVLPFLVAKKQQAQLILKALSILSNCNPRTTKVRHTRLAILQKEISALNRGVHA